MINKNSFISLAVALSLVTTSCSLLPVSEQTRDILAQIKNKTLEEDRFHLNEQAIFNDKKISNYLQKTLRPILELYKIKDVSIFVVETYEAQGSMFSEERSIFISKGMLYTIKNEAELVALLGHEVGHLKLDHLSRSAKQKDSKIPGVIKDVVESTTAISVPEEVETEAEDLYLSQFNQKKEQEADEFGVLTAARLGYDAYLFADLFNRLSDISDKGISEKLKNLLKGSHKALEYRAKHIKDYLKSNGIKKEGKALSENYLKNVEHLGTVLNTAASLKAQKNLVELYDKLEDKKSLSFDEFISYMQKIRSIAEDLNILSQLVYQNKISPLDNDFFMMESVKVQGPWWTPQNSNLKKLNDTLTLLGRMGVGTIPIVGDAVDMYEVLSGKDFFTNENLSFGERVASAIGIFAGSGKKWRSASKELEDLGEKVISKAINEKEVSAVAKVAIEAIDDSPLLGKTGKAVDVISKKQAKEIQKQYRLIKNEENYIKLKELSDDIYHKKIPDDWKVKVSKIRKGDGKYQGLEFVHPDKDIKIRIMPGDKSSKFPNSRKPYVRQTVHGQHVDVKGNKIERNSEEGHIPLNQWEFKDFWTEYLKKQK